jgi:predicted CoA-binding protein
MNIIWRRNMNQAIENFINGKRIAVAGVSRSGKKFGNTIYTELKERGYQVFAVHPEAQEIGGEKCYPNLMSLKGQVDGVVICVPPRQVESVVQDAARAGLRNVWLQQGAESPEAIKLGKDLGLNLVSGKCILMYAPPVRSFHNFHRFFAKLFGKL